MSRYDYDDDYDDYDRRSRRVYASAGSALRCATKKNPRNLPCPTCGEKNRLTQEDVSRGYQCDACADRAERGYD